MRFLAPFLLTLALSSSGYGQAAEFWFGGGQSLISNGGIGTTDSSGVGTKDDVKLTDGFRIQFRLALNTRAFFGHEVGYAYNRTQLRFETQNPPVEQGMAIHQGFYNFLVYATKEGSRVRPFGTGGVHFSNFVPPGTSATQGGGQTKFGINYGAGIKVKLTSLFKTGF